MASIQASPHPLVFPAAALPAGWHTPGADGRLIFRTSARALEGMQKEAVVQCEGSERVWRMVCDEGPYLNGTDLAPFPLGFFCAGMVCSFMEELLVLLKARGITYSKVKLVQDNRYGMEGSALKGTMTGSALPVELQLVIDSPAAPALLQQLLLNAVAASPAGALLDGVHVSEFTLTHNGVKLAPQRVRQTEHAAPRAPEGFDALAPDARAPFPDDIITKLKPAEIKQGIAGGAGTSMAENQKRILHMQGVCTLREDGLKEVTVDLYQPIGSRFRFLSDEAGARGGRERAPGGLAYLSAGLAFCFMTQFGRYAGIRKMPLESYAIVQDTCFSRPGEAGGMEPVVTHAFLVSEYDDDYARQVLDMSEQTCFLHAACREAVRVKLKNISYAIPEVP